MEYFEEKPYDEYEISKVVLKDGTEIDVNKQTHIAVLKTGSNNNVADFKISFCIKENDDLRLLSDKCYMLAHAFNLMNKYKISFVEACTLYDTIMEEKREIVDIMNGKNKKPN